MLTIAGKLSQQIKLTGKDTNGQFLAISQDNPPNTQIPMHVHQNEDEVYKVLEGEIEFTVGNKKSILKSGDTIFLLGIWFIQPRIKKLREAQQLTAG